MPRPSDPLLRWLRGILSERKFSASALADQAGIPRPRLRHVLGGTDAMTVDELVAITRVLELSPRDFGVATNLLDGEAEPSEEADEADEVDDLVGDEDDLENLQVAMQVDFMFLARAADLADSGVPASVLSRYTDKDLPIKLDAAYHSYNDPRYDESGVRLTLSFDALYECRFPWTSIKQVIFFPLPPAITEEEEEEDDQPPPPKKPFLRLVE